MNILLPITITPGMFSAGTTIGDPDATRGEAAWVASASYAVGQERVYSGSVYLCKAAHTGIATTPDKDTTNWTRLRPSNRWAPFDYYIGTKALATTSLTYVLQPGFFTGLKLHGIDGDRIQITVKDAPAGTVVASLDQDLWEQASGLYELLFVQLARRSQITMDGLPLRPSAELTITVSSAAGVTVGLGYLSVGSWVQLIGTSKFGGPEYGAEAIPKSYGYTKYYPDGTYEYIPRRSATDLNISVVLDADQASYAHDILQQIIDKPVSVEVSNLPRYGFLSTVGVVSGRITVDSWNIAKAVINVKGFI